MNENLVTFSNIENLSKYILENKKLPIANWRYSFRDFKLILSSNSENILNCLLLLKEITYYLSPSDFEIKLLFNSLIDELTPLFCNHDTVIKNLNTKIFSKLLNFSENIEFIVKQTINNCLQSDEWNMRYSCIVLLNLIIKEKKEFFTDKLNYTKKLIEVLVLHSKDNSEKVLSSLTNYPEVTKNLRPEILTEIYKLTNNRKIETNKEIQQILSNSILIKNVENNFINESEILNKKIINYYYQNGFAFGIFPKILIDQIDKEISIDLRTESLQKIKSILEQNVNNQEFLKYSSTFYSIIADLCEDSYSSINLISLEILNKLLNIIPGVNIIANIHHSISILIKCLGNNSIQIRQSSKNALDKIMMVIPTSQLIPYIVNNLYNQNTSWVLLVESLEMLLKIFSSLNSIYNDIDFSNSDCYDVNIFLEIIKLFHHKIPKVSITARKVIKFVGQNTFEKENFLKTIEYYLSSDVYLDVENLIRNQNLKILHKQNNINNPYSSIRIINLLKNGEINVNKDDYDHYENFVIYKNIAKYENLEKNENLYSSQNNKSHFNVDENLMLESQDKSMSMIMNQLDKETQLISNYQNYDLDFKNDNKQDFKKAKKYILKSRMKRYNDPSDHDLEEKFDKNYNYEYKPRETLSPLKHSESIFQNLYQGLKSNLNWEKQFKCLDDFRKIMYYNPEIMIKDSYLTNLIIEEVLNLTSSIRSLLARNALTTLSEIFITEGVIIIPKYESIFKILVKKTNDKNEFICKEARRALVKFISNCDTTKASLVIFDNLIKKTSIEEVSLNIYILTKMIYFHEDKFINNIFFNKCMSYISDLFHKMRNHLIINQALVEFFKYFRSNYKSDEEFENILKNYFSFETLNKILNLIYE